MQESSYKLNTKGVKCGVSIYTGEKDCIAIDFGIGQINHKTIKSHGFDRQKLMSDLEYSVEAAAKVLSDFKSFKKSEPDMWWTRYNCGTRPMSKVGDICKTYYKLVARHM